MMGKGHAVSGAAAWLLIAETGAFGLELDLAQTVAGTALAAGAALLPDLDHPQATAGRSAGIAGQAAAGVLGAATGGHRHGLHSLLAIVGFGLGATYLGRWTHDLPLIGETATGSVIMLAVLAVFATRALKLSRAGLVRLWVVMLAAALAATIWLPQVLEIVPVVVMVGVAVHLAGDFLTVGGLPLIWPLTIRPPRALRSVPIVSSIWKPNGYWALPVLGNAGSIREWVLVAALTGYVLLAGTGLFTGQTSAELLASAIG